MWAFTVCFLDYINRETAATGKVVSGRQEAFDLLDQWMADKLVVELVIHNIKKRKKRHRKLSYTRMDDGDWGYTDVTLRPGDFGYGRYCKMGFTKRKPGGGTQGGSGAAPARRVRPTKPRTRRTMPSAIPVGR